MHKPLEKLLKETKTKFAVLTHKIVYTAHDEAETQKKKLNEIAKTVLVKADKALALVVLPAGKYVDLKGVGRALKVKTVQLAKENEIAKKLKTKVGLLHPFGNLYKLPTLLDRTLAHSKKLLASAGSYTESVELRMKDFEKLVKPVKGIFSKSKK